MNSISCIRKQEHFKRRKTVVAEYPYTDSKKIEPIKQIVQSSFACHENLNNSLFRGELSCNMAFSILTIMRYREQQDLHLLDEDPTPLKVSNEFDITDSKIHNVIVLTFNMMHAIFNNLHTGRAKLRHIESDLLKNCEEYIHSIKTPPP
jgi:hypothetical protein